MPFAVEAVTKSLVPASPGTTAPSSSYIPSWKLASFVGSLQYHPISVILVAAPGRVSLVTRLNISNASFSVLSGSAVGATVTNPALNPSLKAATELELLRLLERDELDDREELLRELLDRDELDEREELLDFDELELFELDDREELELDTPSNLSMTAAAPG